MYNWRNLDAKSKQPTFVHFSDDRPFGLAGIWERWKPDDDRMPVILRPTSWSRSHA